VMAEQAASAGLAALTFDFRGHGRSAGVLGPDGWHDAVAAGQLLLGLSGAPWLAARGASLGGCFLVLAAAAYTDLFRSLVLLCPADGPSLLAGLDDLDALGIAGGGEGHPTAHPAGEYSGRFDAAALRPYLSQLDLVEVARGMPRVLLVHAHDDDVVPFAHSRRLAAVLAPPTRFIALSEGGHRGPGRSPKVARETLAWVLQQGM
jgi:uncharacterized protein